MISMDGLQIGNWLEHRFSPLVARVTDLSSSGLIRIEGIYDWLHMSAYSPIPLTSEILIACGFVAQYFEGEISYYEYDTWPSLTIKDGVVDLYDFGSNVPIIYLHQLQNCWYFKEGEELIYKP